MEYKKYINNENQLPKIPAVTKRRWKTKNKGRHRSSQPGINFKELYILTHSQINKAYLNYCISSIICIVCHISDKKVSPLLYLICFFFRVNKEKMLQELAYTVISCSSVIRNSE